jgi:hypothetical protein
MRKQHTCYRNHVLRTCRSNEINPTFGIEIGGGKVRNKVIICEILAIGCVVILVCPSSEIRIGHSFPIPEPVSIFLRFLIMPYHSA